MVKQAIFELRWRVVNAYRHSEHGALAVQELSGAVG
jgi:hypothetical protein